ncbi:tetrachloroethene dehalogenase [Enterovibrio sp. ZSDZ35]|uniref:Tetrachloroethene dehalogenase n=1 Tax=Enterovibrio qingdaonensis TaxID=2899818 RepID=A0ABT5QRG4_9GAMM|nr:tetrachloroethene dehalogenase [Enterovibrio sp. ZSDZ35]MDD1783484.1 tetrachloroethene dehalogenase [Enterovibrio sp. ZSDZ35]
MIGLMWYLMGMMTVGAAWWYAEIKKRYDITVLANLGLVAVFVILWVCIGWSWASFAEGEPQSGAMGLVCFGLPGVILLNLVWKRLIVPTRKTA